MFDNRFANIFVTVALSITALCILSLVPITLLYVFHYVDVIFIIIPACIALVFASIMIVMFMIEFIRMILDK